MLLVVALCRQRPARERVVRLWGQPSPPQKRVPGRGSAGRVISEAALRFRQTTALPSGDAPPAVLDTLVTATPGS